MRKTFVLILMMGFVLLLTSCKEKGDLNNDVLNEGMKIYYLNNSRTKIVDEPFSPSSKTRDDLVLEYFKALKKDPTDVSNRKAVPNNVSLLDFSFIEEDRLTINFDSSYNQLGGIEEVLCRAALVKTLGQIDGLEYIEFTVVGLPLMDSNDKLVGLMTSESFIESTSSETNYKAVLYFANEKGDLLVGESIYIFYTGSISIEEMVILQLINGPTEVGINGTIPKGTTLLNITTKDSICYVDFNEKFIEEPINVKDDVTIYSIVNTLVELPTVSRVQFLINGESQKRYRKDIAFDGLFERNLALIEGDQ